MLVEPVPAGAVPGHGVDRGDFAAAVDGARKAGLPADTAGVGDGARRGRRAGQSRLPEPGCVVRLRAADVLRNVQGAAPLRSGDPQHPRPTVVDPLRGQSDATVADQLRDDRFFLADQYQHFRRSVGIPVDRLG